MPLRRLRRRSCARARWSACSAVDRLRRDCPPTGESFPAATPPADVRPGRRARRPASRAGCRLSDYASGRAAQGYRCNTKLVAHQGTTGGFKVLRYRDAPGHACAFYDSTLLFPKDVLYNAAEGLGVVVLDMTNPAKPRRPPP